jgi:hypothetical protein
MDSSKMENKQFEGITLIDINDGINWKFRIAKIASTFTAEALAIIKKTVSKQNVVIFSDSESVLKGISNTSTMNNTSRITQMLKDKT